VILRPRRAVALVLVGTLAVACGGATTGTDVTDSTADTTGTTDGAPLSGDLVVFATASLTDVFDELATDFLEVHPDLTYVPNYAGSQALVLQLAEGAPADVLVSANIAQMDRAVEAGRVSTTSVLTENTLAIVVEAGNPLDIASLEDLARDDVVLVLAGEEVPAGQYAAEVLDAQGIEVSPASLEVDVRAVLAKVSLGEADAGIVYRSDLVAAGDTVEAVAIPDEQNVVAVYPMAVLDDAPNRAAAEAFTAFLATPEAQATLEAAGFGAAR
jgi:molybdate transport system substrate-binding protein